MKILAVARFTLLRFWRTRYVLAAGTLGVVIFLIQWATSDSTNKSLQLTNIISLGMMWLTSIWLGMSLVQADRIDGTLRSTLTRPISLVEVLLGKLVGGFFYLAFLAVVLTAAILLGALVGKVHLSWDCVIFQIHLLPVHLTVMALTLLLAQVLPRFAAGLIALFAWDDWVLEKIGLLSDKVNPLAADTLRGVGRILHVLLPPTSHFYVTYGDFVKNEFPPLPYLLLLPYSVHFAVAACLLAAWSLGREEL